MQILVKYGILPSRNDQADGKSSLRAVDHFKLLMRPVKLLQPCPGGGDAHPRLESGFLLRRQTGAVVSNLQAQLSLCPLGGYFNPARLGMRSDAMPNGVLHQGLQ